MTQLGVVASMNIVSSLGPHRECSAAVSQSGSIEGPFLMTATSCSEEIEKGSCVVYVRSICCELGGRIQETVVNFDKGR